MIFQRNILESKFFFTVIIFIVAIAFNFSSPLYAKDGGIPYRFSLSKFLSPKKINKTVVKIAAPTKQSITKAVIRKPARKPEQLNLASINHDTDTKTFLFPKNFKVNPIKKPMPISNGTRLDNKNIELYKAAFALQEQAKWSEANDKIKQLSDMRLSGYLSYQRYKNPKYNSTETELRNWLSVYSNYAMAYDIYRFANKKFKAGFQKPKKQKTLSHKITLQSPYKIHPYISRKRRNSSQRKDVKILQRRIARYLGKDAPTKALQILTDSKNSKYLDNIEEDILRADIASAYFYLSLFDKAQVLAVKAADRSGYYAPLAGWIAGMCAWQKQDYSLSAKYFSQAANAKRNSDWMRSAASYWSARANMRNHLPHKAVYWLKNASRYSRSFYGLIAMQSLGMKTHTYDWSQPEEENESHIEQIAKLKNGYLIISLLDAGQGNLAVEELRRIKLNNNDTKLKEALFVFANRYNMPSMAIQLASTVKRPNGKFYDTGLYPVSPWEPKDGYKLSPSLIHAFIRQESRFNPHANSHSGAKGLMQLMPTTASYLAKKPQNYFKSDNGEATLLDPNFNMSLGQKYLSKLLNNSSINQNLFQLTAAYNAGPGRLSRWKKNLLKNPMVTNDPLLFIEMLPAAETRAFTEQVMANYWIYNLRFHGRTPNSLKATASGRWPNYDDDQQIEIADKK